MLNIDRSKREEVMKRMKHWKVPGVDDITVEELEVVTIGSRTRVLLRLCREMGTQSDPHGMEALSHDSHTQEGQADCSDYMALVCHVIAIRSSPLSCKGSRAEQRKS